MALPPTEAFNVRNFALLVSLCRQSRWRVDGGPETGLTSRAAWVGCWDPIDHTRPSPPPAPAPPRPRGQVALKLIPTCFVIGAGFEWFMIKVKIGEETFCR